MRTRSALMVAAAVGFSLLGCSEEAAGPGAGPDTSWQIFCSDNDPDMLCGTSQAPHGPLDGLDDEDTLDDYELDVSCSRRGSGLEIRIEDPGRPENVDRKQPRRPRSILTMTRGKPESNECRVEITEYPNAGGRLAIQDTCVNTELAIGEPGSCTLEGEEDSDGYAFNGTLICDGMRLNGVGDPVYLLRQARRQQEPVVLQIANCD